MKFIFNQMKKFPDLLLNNAHYLCTIFLIWLVFRLLRILRNRRKVVKCVNKIPSLKLKFYQIFGHLSMLLWTRMFRSSTSVSTHAQEFLAGLGYTTVFPKEGICSIWYFHHPVSLVYKASTVETILSSSTEIEKAWFYKFFEPWIGSGLFTSSGNSWRERRKLLTPSFHYGILDNFITVFNKQSRILVGELLKPSCDYVNILPLISKCSLDIMFETMMGKELNSQTCANVYDEFAVSILTRGTSIRMQKMWLWNEFLFKLSPTGKEYMKNVKLLHDFIKELIAEKKKSYRLKENPIKPKESLKKLALLDLLLYEHLVKNTMSEKDLIEEINAFAFAGFDTTAVAISWILYLVGLHPWVQDKIHQEMDAIFGEDEREATMGDLKGMQYLECVIKESLRLFPSAPGFGRTATNDIRFLEKYTVPKGSTIYVLSYILHRDPEYFPNPEKFDPDRFCPENSKNLPSFAFVPFSAGPRNCMGQKFSMLEQKTVLSSIFRKLKIRSLDPRDKVQLVHEIVLRPVGELKLQIRRRDQEFDFHSLYYFP